jgi:acyl-CoA synthetase (AMP-forming)/AMP-acid ligase II
MRGLVSPSDPSTTAASLVEVLQARADATPDEMVFCFLIDGEEDGPRLTYAELDRQARGIAAVLRDQAEPGDRALLLYEPGLAFVPAFFGCLYAGILPVPACPPRLVRLAQSWQTLAGIASDCQPNAVLTTGDLAAGLAKGLGNLTAGASPHCLATDLADSSHARRWRQPRIDPDAAAFLQYTSGSTAAPKGVTITHRNLMHSERAIETVAEHCGLGSGVCWVPLYHDFGLVAGVLQGMFHRSPVIIMSPLAMLQRPIRWLQAISRYRSDTSGGPTFGYDLCVQRITPDQKAALDLSTWSVAGVGGEPVSARTLECFAEAFAPCGFRPEAFCPCYGLAEATLGVTSVAKKARPTVRRVHSDALEQGRVLDAPSDAPGVRSLVSCGRPLLDTQVVIVHPDTRRRCADETVGEIWVAGPAVAQGYWNRPEETERTFRARLSDTGEGPFLRTGDLGFLSGGELFVTGRLKDVIVIRGRNHYPEDIETTVQSVHPALRAGCGAAFETGNDGPPRLVIAQEVDRRTHGVDVKTLIGDIRQVVAERHELMVHDVQFLEPGGLPRTSSGKVQRHACRLGYERGTLRRWRGT